jgi:hypothetical protein
MRKATEGSPAFAVTWPSPSSPLVGSIDATAMFTEVRFLGGEPDLQCLHDLKKRSGKNQGERVVKKCQDEGTGVLKWFLASPLA